MAREMYLRPKDYMSLARVSRKTADTLFTAIRDAHGKKKYQLVSIEEFCKYTFTNEEELRKNLDFK